MNRRTFVFLLAGAVAARPLAASAQRIGKVFRVGVLNAGTDTPKPLADVSRDAFERLVKLLIRARRFNATLVGSDGLPFAALAKRQGVSPSYFTRLVRLSYLDPDITEASSTAVSRAI